MKIKQFIEKAIEGGYEVKRTFTWNAKPNYKDDEIFLPIVLDPKAWEAVGKVEGWIPKEDGGEMRCDSSKCESILCSYAGYINPTEKMHQMIDALAEGKSIEEYLVTL